MYCHAIPLLRRATVAGDRDAARRLAELLVDRGDVEGASSVLQERADAGDGDAAWRLAGLLVDRGDVEGLRERADAGDDYAAGRLAGLLVDRGDVERASSVLRERADAGDDYAAWRLAELLADRGDLEGLRSEVLRGNHGAAKGLINVLVKQSPDAAERLRRYGLNVDGSISWSMSEAPPSAT